MLAWSSLLALALGFARGGAEAGVPPPTRLLPAGECAILVAFAAARVVPSILRAALRAARGLSRTPRARLPPLTRLQRTERGPALGLSCVASAHPPARLQGVIGSRPGGCAESLGGPGVDNAPWTAYRPLVAAALPGS